MTNYVPEVTIRAVDTTIYVPDLTKNAGDDTNDVANSAGDTTIYVSELCIFTPSVSKCIWRGRLDCFIVYSCRTS